MAEPDKDPLMQEIEDELRQEQLSKLWKAYGNYVVGLAVAVVAVVAGYQGWTAYERNQQQEITSKLVGASLLVEQGEIDNAIESFAQISDGDGTGVRLLAALREAGLLAKQGKHAEAADAYLKIAADSGVPQTFRDMATLLGTMQKLDAGNVDAADAVTQLEPLRADNNPWRHSAREFSAIAAVQAGDKAAASKFLQAISLDPEAPPGVRSRAEELRQAVTQ